MEGGDIVCHFWCILLTKVQSVSTLVFSTFLINILVSDEEDEAQVSKEEENKEGEDPEKSDENDKLEEEKGPEEGVDSGGGSGGGDEEPEDNSAPSNTFGQCQNSLIFF